MGRITSVFVADWGEATVRIRRGCVDMGIDSWSDRPEGLDAGDAADLLARIRHSGADAVHPGWGPYAADALFAEQVLAQGLTWVGSPPLSLAAIKRESGELPFLESEISPVLAEAAESSRRRRITADFLRDTSGTVVVAGLRGYTDGDCHELLVEESPVPGWPEAAHKSIEDLLAKAAAVLGHVGAGCCDLEVVGNRVHVRRFLPYLSVRHPLSEEVSGLDFVQEQLRIARGERLLARPRPTGKHGVQMRLLLPVGAGGQAENGGSTLVPGGPGIRWDGASFETQGEDSLTGGTLVAVGSDRLEALHRAQRAIREVVSLAPPEHAEYLRILEGAVKDAGELTSGAMTASRPGLPPPLLPERAEEITVAIEGQPLQVQIPRDLLFGADARGGGVSSAPAAPRRSPRNSHARGAGSEAPITAPMQGRVVKVCVKDGESVEASTPVLVLEAMKMEQPLLAGQCGTVTGLAVEVGDTVPSGMTLATIVPKNAASEEVQ